MNKYLVLIDNQKNELEKMVEILKGKAEKESVIIESLYCNESREGVELFKRFYDNLENDPNATNAIISVVVDICLTEDEEQLQRITGETSGIRCLQEINELLNNSCFNYNLYLMTRFFLKQASELEIVQQIVATNDRFIAVIKKPLLEDGKIDKGSSKIKQYMNYLPEDKLSLKYVTSFKNILFFGFEG